VVAIKGLGVSLPGAASSADLGVVAIIQTSTLNTEVEKGSMATAVDHGLAVPKV